MRNKNNHVCPVEIAGILDNRIRKWLQNPRKIMEPHIEEGMTVLDIGCGPGFFSIEMAQIVGKTGRIIAADLQEGMLQKLRQKIRGTELEGRITLHKAEGTKIGVLEPVDFVLAFYVVHELSNQDDFFSEMISILKPDGHILIVEPPFHVSHKAFAATIQKAHNAGFIDVEKPKVSCSKAVLLSKA